VSADLNIEIQPGTEPLEVRLTGALTRKTVAAAFDDLKPVFERAAPAVLDVAGVTAMDSAGLALVAHGMRRLGRGDDGLSLRGVGGEVAKALKLAGWVFTTPKRADDERRVMLAEVVGEGATAAVRNIHYYLYLISETLYHGLISPFRREKPRVRIFLEQMARLGAGSAPIVWLIALLVGLTTAFQAAYELRRFGANIYIADLVSISMMTELGPLMAAILVAGRSGAAVTAEIGTMQVNEEIDALRLIGVAPIQYLVVPRVYAVVITQALLGVTSAIVGIFGGFVIAITSLDLSPLAFLNEALSSLLPIDLINNIIKSAIFGFIIVTVGAFYGLRVSGGAEGVGRATTSSVVTSIFLIVVADCIYSLI